MKKKLLPLLAAATMAATLLGTAATAGAQDPPALPKNPVKACAWLEANMPDLYEFIATKPGACVSTIASVGLERLLAGEFPSNAAAVGQCKALEAEAEGRPYPYQFYGFVPGMLTGLAGMGVITQEQLEWALAYYASISDRLYARNRADCVRILRQLHPDGGIMGPIFAILPPQ